MGRFKGIFGPGLLVGTGLKIVNDYVTVFVSKCHSHNYDRVIVMYRARAGAAIV